MMLDGRMQAEDDKAAANAPASRHGPDAGPCLSSGSYARLFATTVTTRSFVMTTSIGSILSGEGKVFANGHGSVERVILKKGGKSNAITIQAKTCLSVCCEAISMSFWMTAKSTLCMLATR
jgi:hypothetical protein